MLAPWKKSYDKPRQSIKKKSHHSANKGASSQSYVFSRSYVWLLELDHKKAERWWINAFELWCWRRLLRVSYTARRSNQSFLKEISPEYSLEELIMLKPLLGHLMQKKSQLIRKDLDAGKDWRQEEKGTKEDKMVGWHHWLSGHEFERALGDGEGQGRLACCCPWGHKELETTEWWNSALR